MTASSLRRSHYVPWLFLGAFALIIAVNATMIWLAVSSFSGLYTTKPREIGLRYNAVIAEQKARDALGWRTEATWRRESGTVALKVVDSSGQPLSGARVTVELVRPVEKKPPLEVQMTAVDLGAFEGHVDLTERGNWDVDIVV